MTKLNILINPKQDFKADPSYYYDDAIVNVLLFNEDLTFNTHLSMTFNDAYININGEDYRFRHKLMSFIMHPIDVVIIGLSRFINDASITVINKEKSPHTNVFKSFSKLTAVREFRNNQFHEVIDEVLWNKLYAEFMKIQSIV